ncbi:PsiF family protein [Roseomonas sp. NAR14]|uniref:PsiF family protein n=1 Tax=Roseomonas acroporae TaxID=2937791 RepID=A0A9X1YEW4_9PROT|nr:PsiF family protein [Roseomonas acroporae]MCK8787703.1 PsiF family protein [Roseomonas acroporae]
MIRSTLLRLAIPVVLGFWAPPGRAAEPTALPPATVTPATAAPPGVEPLRGGQHERMRRCNAEARGQSLHGEPRRAFMRTCLSGGGATPAAAVGPAAAASSATGGASGANGPREYRTESEARTACVGTQIVWGNPARRIYHLGGSRHYGTTRQGAYFCQAAADAAGFRQAGKRARQAPG